MARTSGWRRRGCQGLVHIGGDGAGPSGVDRRLWIPTECHRHQAHSQPHTSQPTYSHFLPLPIPGTLLPHHASGHPGHHNAHRTSNSSSHCRQHRQPVVGPRRGYCCRWRQDPISGRAPPPPSCGLGAADRATLNRWYLAVSAPEWQQQQRDCGGCCRSEAGLPPGGRRRRGYRRRDANGGREAVVAARGHRCHHAADCRCASSCRPHAEAGRPEEHAQQGLKEEHKDSAMFQH